MVKNLIHKLKEGTKKAREFIPTLGLGALLLFNSCLSNNCKSVIGPDPYTATASLSVSPQSGIAPLEVRILLNGYPSDKIVEYSLKINSSESYSSPGSYGLSSSISSKTINQFSRPNTIDRTRIRDNTGANTNKELGNQRIRGPVRTKKIKDVDKNLINRQQIRKNELTYDSTQVRIPGNIIMSPQGLEENIQRYKRVTTLQDINEVITSARPINITRVYDNSTKENFTIFITGNVTDEDGRISSSVSKNIIINPKARDVHLFGILKENGTGFSIPGVLKVFDSGGELLMTDKSDSQGYITTDSLGRFDFNVENIDSKLEEMVIKAVHGTSGNPQSWVRTVNVPTTDNNNLNIVAVPYGEFSSNPDEFRDFMYEVTGDGNLRKFDSENFNRGFVILKENLNEDIDKGNPEGQGKFSDEQIAYIRNLITPGVENVDKIVGTNNYSINTQATSENYEPGAGVIYIIPSTAPGGNPDYGGLYVPTSVLGNLTQGVDIYIKDSLASDKWEIKAVILHEILHMLYSHSTNPNSRMYSGGPTHYTNLDLKGAKIVYELTYSNNDLTNGYPVENLKNILGKNFNDWN